MNLILKIGNKNDQTELFQIAAQELTDMGQYANEINLNKTHELEIQFSNLLS